MARHLTTKQPQNLKARQRSHSELALLWMRPLPEIEIDVRSAGGGWRATSSSRVSAPGPSTRRDRADGCGPSRFADVRQAPVLGPSPRVLPAYLAYASRRQARPEVGSGLRADSRC